MNAAPIQVAVGRVVGGPPRETWVAASSRGVVLVSLGRGRGRMRKALAQKGLVGGGPGVWVLPALRELADYFAGRRQHFAVPVCPPEISPFASKVLGFLQAVPYGATVTYGELARLVGSPRASRAVGGVMATNPLPLFIPCHRVVASRGLGGFGGGLRMKRDLLRLEGVALSGSSRSGR